MGGSVPENGRKSQKMKSIVPDLSEKNYGMYILEQLDLSSANQPITRRQNFRLFQIETNGRRHFKVHLK